MGVAGKILYPNPKSLNPQPYVQKLRQRSPGGWFGVLESFGNFTFSLDSICFGDWDLGASRSRCLRL